MMFTELIITVNLKKNIYYEECGYMIGKNINKSMLLNKELKELHPQNKYKNYVFNGLYPIEKDKIYKQDRLYIFKIRGMDEDTMNRMYSCLWKLKSDDFMVLSVSKRDIINRKIGYLYTQTPVIITVDDRPWLQQEGDIEVFIRRLTDNIEKKYRDFFNEDIDLKDKFVDSIEFKNRVPMCFKYKGIRLLANKVKVNIQNNEDAQKAAFLARAVGLGEKNSAVGAGFCE